MYAWFVQVSAPPPNQATTFPTELFSIFTPSIPLLRGKLHITRNLCAVIFHFLCFFPGKIHFYSTNLPHEKCKENRLPNFFPSSWCLVWFGALLWWNMRTCVSDTLLRPPRQPERANIQRVWCDEIKWRHTRLLFHFLLRRPNGTMIFVTHTFTVNRSEIPFLTAETSTINKTP